MSRLETWRQMSPRYSLENYKGIKREIEKPASEHVQRLSAPKASQTSVYERSAVERSVASLASTQGLMQVP